MLLHSNEQLVKIFRRCPLTYFWHWFLVFIFVTAPFFFMFVLFSWGKWGVGLFIVSLVIALFILLRSLFYWRKNILVATTERIIKVERKSLMNKNVVELNFHNIRSISYKIKGFFPTIFGYGKIIIQTTDAKGEAVEIDKIRKPVTVVNILAAIQQKQMQDGYKPLNLESVLHIIKNETKENLLKIKEGVDNRLKELL